MTIYNETKGYTAKLLILYPIYNLWQKKLVSSYSKTVVDRIRNFVYTFISNFYKMLIEVYMGVST